MYGGSLMQAWGPLCTIFPGMAPKMCIDLIDDIVDKKTEVDNDVFFFK